MSDITLVRLDSAEISEADKQAARRVLFGAVDGLGESDKRKWRRLMNGLLRLEPGEMVEIHTRKPRSGPFHRRHMALEQRVFAAQEAFTVFAQFRNWLKVGAGHCDWVADPTKEGLIPQPRSLAYDQLEEDDMREFHENAVTFLRSARAGAVLWPHLSAPRRPEAIEQILQEFQE